MTTINKILISTLFISVSTINAMGLGKLEIMQESPQKPQELSIITAIKLSEIIEEQDSPALDRLGLDLILEELEEKQRALNEKRNDLMEQTRTISNNPSSIPMDQLQSFNKEADQWIEEHIASLSQIKQFKATRGIVKTIFGYFKKSPTL